jgi:hypothetical protein
LLQGLDHLILGSIGNNSAAINHDQPVDQGQQAVRCVTSKMVLSWAASSRRRLSCASL